MQRRVKFTGRGASRKIPSAKLTLMHPSGSSRSNNVRDDHVK